MKSFFDSHVENKVSLCYDPPASVRPSDRPSDRPSGCPDVINFNIGHISDNSYSRATKLDQKVVCSKTFEIILCNMTLTQGQGHGGD